MKVVIRESSYDYESDYPEGWKFSAGDYFKFPVLVGPHRCFVKRFHKKANEISGWELLNGLKGKYTPNLPRVFDIVRVEEAEEKGKSPEVEGSNVYYVFQECLPGKTLDKIIAEKSGIDLQRLAADLLCALQSIYQHGFWFADFCEKNIFCEQGGSFFLIDLDSAQPAAELPRNEMYADKEYWSLVLDFYRKILHKNLLSEHNISTYSIAGITLNYLQVPFLILRLQLYATSAEYTSERVHDCLPAALDHADAEFKDLFIKVLQKDGSSLGPADIDVAQIRHLIDRIIHKNPVIKWFTTSSKQVQKAEVFTLSWWVEDADKIELHRNGVLLKTIEPAQKSIEMTEFQDGKNDVSYRLIAYKGAGSVQSTTLVVSLAIPLTKPVIRSFTASKKRVEKAEAFTLHWQVEQANKMELYRNGAFCEPISVGQQSTTRTEFKDSKKEVFYQIIAYQDDTPVESEKVVIQLNNKEDREGFNFSSFFIWVSKPIKALDALQRIRLFRNESALLLVLIITTLIALLYLIKTNFLPTPKAANPVFYTFEPRQIQGIASIKVFGDNFTNNVEVLFNNIKGSVYQVSKNSLSVIVPRLYNHDTTVNVVVVINQDTLRSAYQLTYLATAAVEKPTDTVSVPVKDTTVVSPNTIKPTVKKRKGKSLSHALANSSNTETIQIGKVYQQIRDLLKSNYQENKSGILNLSRERFIVLENTSSYFLDSVTVQIRYQSKRALKKDKMIFKKIEPYSKYQQAAPKDIRKDINCVVDSVYLKIPLPKN